LKETTREALDTLGWVVVTLCVLYFGGRLIIWAFY
jgi:hypothetical protein